MCIDALQSAPKLVYISVIARFAYLRRNQFFQVSVFPDLTLLFQALSFCSLRCLCYSRDTMLPQISAQVMHAKLDDHTLAMLGIAPALVPPRRWLGDAERWTSKKARVSS